MRATYSTMTSLIFGKRTSKYEGTDAEACFEAVKYLNALNDTTAFSPVEIMAFVNYIPKWLARYALISVYPF